jgi:hypothetical protein
VRVPRFLRCVLSEWPFLRARLVRTRLGLWLTLLLIALIWIDRTAAIPDPLGTALRAGALAAVLCVAYLAGSAADRAALALPALHPSSPGAVVAGRWVAATSGAGLVVLAATAHAAGTAGAAATMVRCAVAGLATAAVVAACTLALVWCGGNLLAGCCFLWLAFFGGIAPEAAVRVAHPTLARVALATALEVAPSPWRYRGIAEGDPGAAAHALVWSVMGLVLARRRAMSLATRP